MTAMTVKGLSALLSSIESFPKLSALTLNIGNNPLHNSTAQLLADTLSKLTHLESLDLGIDSLFNESGRTYLIDRIGKLPNLKNLEIGMIHTNLSGTGLESLLGLSSLRNLKKLHLTLVGCSIKATETQHLQKLLAQLPKLDDLFLNLYANRIGVDGAITLAGGIFHQR